MRRFIYLDSDSLNSYLAQIEKGLQMNEIVEHQDGVSSSDTTGESSSIVGDIGAKIFGIGANIKGDMTDSNSRTEVASEFIKKIEEKALHDYIFERVLNYITNNGLIKSNSLIIGDFIFESEKATFFDIDYFLSVFSDTGVVKYSNEKARDQLKESIPQGQTATTAIKIQQKEINNYFKEAEAGRKETLKTIELMKTTLPYNRFLMMNNYLVTLDNSCFRDNPDLVSFKYGGDISVVGYVTNIVKQQDENENIDNGFAPMYQAVNSLMLTLYNNEETIYIIHPLAIFY